MVDSGIALAVDPFVLGIVHGPNTIAAEAAATSDLAPGKGNRIQRLDGVNADRGKIGPDG